MKKITHKLVLHSQTIRAFDTMQLIRVVGGVDTGINCPAQADTGINCPAQGQGTASIGCK